MSHSGRIRPGSISAIFARIVDGTVRGVSTRSPREDLGPAKKHDQTSELRTRHQDEAIDQEVWLSLERIEIEKFDQMTRRRVIHLLFGLFAIVIVGGLGALALCAYLQLASDTIAYFLASVLTILSGAIGVAIGFLFGRRPHMTS